MKRRDLLVLGGVGLLGAAIIASSRRAPRRREPRPPDYDVQPGGGWAWDLAPEAILAQGELLESELGWVGLPEYLLAVAWSESRGNPYACAGIRGAGPDTVCPGNTARGWYQGRPRSMFVNELEGLPSVLLTVPSWATATYAWYTWRTGHNFAGPGQRVDWLAARRGAAYPRLVADVDESKPRSVETRERFTAALDALGIDREFMYEPAFPAGATWPGVDMVLEILDAPAPADVLEAA